MEIALTIAAYTVYLAFCARLLSRVLIWQKAVRNERVGSLGRPRRLPVYVAAAVDLLVFRRLFNSSKLLWAFSWTFHLSFVLVLLRHLRFFLEPSPGAVFAIQPVGLVAGYSLVIALTLLIVFRLVRREDGYFSRDNFLILALVLFTALTGVLMRFYARPDVVEVKSFVIGMLALDPQDLPRNYLLVSHFLSALVLVPLLPSHVFSAPAVTLEAEKRREELEFIIHEE